MSGTECPEPLPADRLLHPKPLIEENSYENARLYCEVGESEKGIAEAREQQFLIPELVPAPANCLSLGNNARSLHGQR